MRHCLDSRYVELKFLSTCIMYGLWTLEFESAKKRKKKQEDRNYMHIGIMLYIIVGNHDIRY